MSMQYCHDCDKHIDTDHDVEHLEEHEDMTKQTKPTGEEQLKEILSRFAVDDMGTEWIEALIRVILDWHEEKVAEAKRELVEKLMEEIDDWYSLAPAYRNKNELVGKIKSLLLAELSDEEVEG